MDTKTSESVGYPSLSATKDPFADSFTNNPNDPTRVYPRSFASGNQQGQQTFGTPDVFMDTANSQMVFSNPKTGVSFRIGVVDTAVGSVGDNDVGITLVDNDNFKLFTLNGLTWSWFDKTTKKNVMQVGLLPDGSYGFAVADLNKDVSEGF